MARNTVAASYFVQIYDEDTIILIIYSACRNIHHIAVVEGPEVERRTSVALLTVWMRLNTTAHPMMPSTEQPSALDHPPVRGGLSTGGHDGHGPTLSVNEHNKNS